MTRTNRPGRFLSIIVALILTVGVPMAALARPFSEVKYNDVMRVLTVFSAFFLPLTFIVGVYGMNFAHMPELQHPWGYPAVMAGMITVAATIFLWFRRKGWLK